MEREFDKGLLRNRLLRLGHWQVVFFTWSVCERMYPNFVRFSDLTGHEGAGILRSSLDRVIKWLKFEPLEDEGFDGNACDAVAPDTEDYDTPLVSAALDAAVAISFLVNSISGEAVELAVEASTLAVDSVDLFVQAIEEIDLNDPFLEVKVHSHELMQRELKMQRECLELLERHTQASSELVEDYRNLSARSSLESSDR